MGQNGTMSAVSAQVAGLHIIWVHAKGVEREHTLLRRVLRRFQGGFRERVLRRVLRRGRAVIHSEEGFCKGVLGRGSEKGGFQSTPLRRAP